MKKVYFTLGIIAIVCWIAFLWRIDKYLSYKWSHQIAVQKDIDDRVNPLEKRISYVEKEIEELKKNK